MNGQVNERQLEVLRWVADGCPDHKWPDNDFSYKTSAAALNSRGLVKIRGRGRSWTATVTDDGRYFLEHGTYPPNPDPSSLPARPRVTATPVPNLDLSDKSSETLQQARALIQQLQDSGTITITDPPESVRSHYRRVLHACRVHHLVPSPLELRFTGQKAGDIIIMLSSGSAADTSTWDRIRTNARRVTTNVDVVRSALETSTILSSVSNELRPRSIEILLDLAEHLRAFELRLAIDTKLKTPKLFIPDGGRRRSIWFEELLNQVPHALTAADQKELRRAPWTRLPQFDGIPSGRLQLRVERDGSHEVRVGSIGYRYEKNSDSWSDEKRSLLEGQLNAIARAIKQGIVDDDDAREREKQRRSEAQEEFERARAAERAAWEEVRTRARESALIARREALFASEFSAWQDARALRAFAAELEQQVTEQGQVEGRPRLRQWIGWARARADALDPILNLTRLDDAAFEPELSPDDLRPFMEGWDPSRPGKDYRGTFPRGDSPTAESSTRDWHPGMRDRPSWWRR